MKITKEQIKKLTDAGSWERGVDYFQRGLVVSLLEDKNIITAKVSGSRNYKVKLQMHDDQIEGACTCPMGDMGVFCKHCVAVGLTYINGGSQKGPGRRSGKSKAAVTTDDIRRYLSDRKKENLIEIIMDRLVDDDLLRQQLMLKAARAGKDGCNTDALKSAIDQATNTHGFVDYHSAYDFHKGIDSVVDSIEELLEDGYSEQVIELAEFALKRAENALGSMDDSDGYMHGIFERLEELHHKACVKAKPDPKKLARRLFNWEISSGWDTFRNKNL